MQRPLVGVIALLENKRQQFLLGRRLSVHAHGMYSCPGGHLEYGESFEDCARRETLEEAGITIFSPSVLDVVNNIYRNEGRHYVCVVMHIRCFSGEPENKEPGKCAGWQWHDGDNLPLPLMPGLYRMIRKITNMRV